MIYFSLFPPLHNEPGVKKDTHLADGANLAIRPRVNDFNLEIYINRF